MIIEPLKQLFTEPWHVSDQLVAFVHRELYGQELERVERHLRLCAPCRAELEAIRTVSYALYRGRKARVIDESSQAS